MPKLYPAVVRGLSSFRRLAIENRGFVATSGLSSSRVSTAGRAATFERLEDRRLYSVSYDGAGYTVVTPAAGDKVVYVSSSAGSDTNTGLSPNSPVKTIAKGKAIVRTGTGDQLLLRRGDTWKETLGTWTKGGRSDQEPLVIGAYGDPSAGRPTLATGKDSALLLGGQSQTVVNHVVIQGITFYADARDPASPTFSGGSGGNEGLRLLASTNDLLVEDCKVDGYTCNVTVATYFGPQTNVRIRRCVVTDAYNLSGNAEGLFADGTNGLTLEENVFDHNGWNTGVAGAVRTIYNHNVYIRAAVSNFVARGNTFSNAGSHGLQARGGGIIEDNTFIDNPIQMSYGQVNGSPITPGGVSGRVTGNTFIGGGSINGTTYGWGIEVSNIRAGGGTTISGNVFANAVPNAGYAIYLTYGNGVTNASQAVGINDLTISNNVVYNWSRAVYVNNGLVSGGTGQFALNNVTIKDNSFQRLVSTTALYVSTGFPKGQIHLSNNHYDSAAGAVMINTGGPASKFSVWGPINDRTSSAVRDTFADAGRTVATYAWAYGVGTSTDDYLQAARDRSTATWHDWLSGGGLSSYFHAGFATV